MKSIKPGKQRKELFNAPLHKKRKEASAHLEEKLLLKYDKRAVPVIKGDTVRVMRGSYKGHEDKIAGVNIKKRHVEIEGLTITKADGKKIAKPIHPSNLLITKLNLTDKWRRYKLERGLTEETKKEIEKEAEEQIKDYEEEQKRIEEEKLDEEAEEEMEETVMELDEETEVTKEEKPKVEKAKPKPKAKEEKTTEEKPKKPKAAEKKAPTKKKTTAKKTPTKKTTKKKEEK